MPHDLSDWLPEDHLARFVVEIVDQLDFKNVYGQYKSGGSVAYNPKLLLRLLFYGYSTGVFSSSKLESSTYNSVAFRFISGNQHPDHDIATCLLGDWLQTSSRIKISSSKGVPGTNPLPPLVPDTGGGPLTPGDNNVEDLQNPNPADSNPSTVIK
ncbi:hypothetical protein CPT03_13435 [Pedobacter ginsengisoli]|uniref:Transposase InsH N-terminal domain-containing protein n=1 Tax=Pedobacter ginsengisoli TaxID=363852 RepID=A0A2D1U740_9SPHI|nr:hypothetical protein CPT03_13435 [Pedobacter ginsengisoli]